MAKIIKGDTVKILLGKDRGKTGVVQRVLPKDNQVLVEGVNLVQRHLKRMGQMEGQTITMNKPLDISNIELVCPKCKKATRVGYKVENEKKVRVCKKCQEVI